MSAPTPAALRAALEATWPAAQTYSCGPVTLRRGAGGGSRVSAATAPGPVGAGAIQAAGDAMQDSGQRRVWRIHSDDPAQAALDSELEAAGYTVRDATVFMSAPAARLAAMKLALMSAFRVWPALAIQREIWDAGGVGPARRAVMERACAPRTTLLGRVGDDPAGTVFVALHEKTAMMHALEILRRHRRQGLARNLIIAAARWTLEQGGDTLALAVTERNTQARSLYHTLGFDTAKGYHYRALED